EEAMRGIDEASRPLDLRYVRILMRQNLITVDLRQARMDRDLHAADALGATKSGLAEPRKRRGPNNNGD
ncbi:MAG: hypothetical protein WEB88_08760, partial [Gemmatimonadota bacterium]